MTEPQGSMLTPQPSETRWPLSWAAIGVLLLCFLALAVAAGTVGTLPGDRRLSTQLQHLHGQPWRTLWHIGNAFGTSGWVLWIALAGLAVAAVLRQWPDVTFILGVLVLRLAMTPIKGIVQSPRPTAHQVHILEHVNGYGFPSGHTLTSTVLFGTIAVLLVRHLPRSWTPRLATAIWVVGVTITGFARVWSGAHWTSDVLGGALLGTAAIAAAARIPAFGSGEPPSQASREP